MQTQAPHESSPTRGRRPVPPPRLLIPVEPWRRVFVRNLKDAVRPRIEPMQMLTSRPAPFWPDVFVDMGIPRRTLTQSAIYHVFVVIALWGLSSTFVFRTKTAPTSFFKNQKITYYDVSEYLPAINTGSTPAKVAQKGQPEYSKQRIISVPPLPDNSTQTIIDPLHLKVLRQDVKLPNMVVWTQTPAPPMPSQNLAKLMAPPTVAPVPPPAQAPQRNLAQLAAPKLDTTVVAPAPDAGSRDLAKLNMPAIGTPGAVQPAPDAGQRKLGEINVGKSDLVATNPAMPIPEQRAANLVGGNGGQFAGAATAVPPPPSLDSGGGIGAQANGQFVALSVRPSPPSGPIEIPGGSRSGIFAATPEGVPGAPGTPDIAGGGTGTGGTGTGTSGAGGGHGNGGGAPTGIYVGGSPATAGTGAVVASTPTAGPERAITSDALKRSLLAAMRSPRPADIPRDSAAGSTDHPDSPTAKLEDKVFGAKKYYSMILNMPNLTSSGGSWIMRFAELRQSNEKGDISAPVALSKADPAYPPELMRKNVEGTVALYAVIHADGTVGEIRVLNSVDDRLDENARRALARWHFRPATRNGNAVDLEAVVFIPFKARKASF